jgi:hypothetical protein
LLKCIEMQDLHAILFNSSIFRILLILFCVDFGEPSKMKFKLFHLEIM